MNLGSSCSSIIIVATNQFNTRSELALAFRAKVSLELSNAKIVELTLPFTSKTLWVLIGLLVAILVAIAAVGLRAYFKSRTHERAFAQIKVGDSKESVVAEMGKPDRVEICRTVSSSNDTAEDKKYQEQCVEQYWYNSFLKPYVISFDKENRVLSKGYQVSP